MFTLALVAGNPNKPLSPATLARVEGFIDAAGLRCGGDPAWLSLHRAADLTLPDKPRPDQMRALRALLAADETDVFITPIATRRAKLFLADMESTMIQEEILDVLAARAGVAEQVAAITHRAMAGELDFRAALAQRLHLLNGTPLQTLEDVRDGLTPSPGAETLMKTLRAHNIKTVLVSGGFTFFTAGVAQKLGFDAHHGNMLSFENGVLSEKIIDPVLNREAKYRLLHAYAQENGTPLKETSAVGDGANDLMMLTSAGLGIGYRAKPLLQERLDNLILWGDLTAILYAQGYHEHEITPS